MSDDQQGAALLTGGSADGAVSLTDVAGLWYVAHTRARNEKILAEELSRYGIFSYLPLAHRVTRSAATGRVSRSMVPVFPGYVFFNGDDDARYRALRTNRIAGVLEVPNQQQLVAELLQMQRLLAAEGLFAVTPRLNIGDWGRITAGPLIGLEGVIARVSGQWRLTMNVTILGQSVSVEVDRHSVEKIDPPAFIEHPARSHDSLA